MTEKNMKRASLSEIRAMKNRGEIRSHHHGFEEANLPEGFWDNAEIVDRSEKTSVHLKLDSDVFDHFKSGGKGHLTRMQNVLASYVRARSGT